MGDVKDPLPPGASIGSLLDVVSREDEIRAVELLVAAAARKYQARSRRLRNKTAERTFQRMCSYIWTRELESRQQEFEFEARSK